MAELENLKGKNWVAAMALCWVLGIFGAHRFYTGKTGSAWAIVVMYLTVILSPIAAIWAVIDGLRIAIGNFKHADGSELYERIPALGYTYIAIVVLSIVTMFLYSAAVFAMIGAMIAAGSSGM